MRVVVVTGSRDWTDRAAIEEALRGAELLLVGDCPTGADAIALEVALAWDVPVIVFVAGGERRARQLRRIEPPIAVRVVSDWKLDRKDKYSAGPLRNQAIADYAFEMRQSGVEEVCCFAFPLPGSRGTYDCRARLKMRGFEVATVEAAR